MLKKFDVVQAENFLKGLKVLTGIPYKKLEKYANENNPFNILEHPNTIEPNPQQFEKISLLNEFIASYKLLKMQEEENKITINATPRAGEYFCSLLGGIKDREKFMVAFLDSGNNIIKESRSAENTMKKRRESIEAGLYRFVMTLEQELKTSRDILRILETYRKNASPEFRNELEITIADMKSGSYEAALMRFEARIGSTMLSDIVRGLLSVLRGDDGRVYFQILAHDFKLLEIQKLKLIAMKRPSKVRKYSFFMLGCFVLMYLGVMSVEIMKAFSTLF